MTHYLLVAEKILKIHGMSDEDPMKALIEADYKACQKEKRRVKNEARKQGQEVPSEKSKEAPKSN